MTLAVVWTCIHKPIGLLRAWLHSLLAGVRLPNEIFVGAPTSRRAHRQGGAAS